MRGTDHAKAMGVVIEEVNIKEGVQYEDKDLEAHKNSKCPLNLILLIVNTTL